MSDADLPTGPGGDQGMPERLEKAAPPGKAKRAGRPPHPVLLKQHPVSVPADLWQWALSQPEGASGLVRLLLESERMRRSGAFYEASVAAGFQTMEVQTPFGDVTVLEMPGTGVMLLRDDDRHHFFSYLADANGWRYSFGDDVLHDMLQVRRLLAPEQAGTPEPPGQPEPARSAKRVRTAKRRKPSGSR